MSDSMRKLINMMGSNTAHQLDEGILDFIKKFKPNLDPIAKARKHGQKEVDNLEKEALQQFAQYMGRNRQDYKNVTWNTLARYLTIRNQLGLSGSDVKKIILDPGTKSVISQKLPGGKVPATWAKPQEPISGNPADPKSEYIAQAIATYIIGLAAIKHLEIAAGGEDVDMTTPVGGQPAPAIAPARAARAQPASTYSYNPATPPQQPVATGNAKADQAAKILYQLQLAMHALAGGNP